MPTHDSPLDPSHLRRLGRFCYRRHRLVIGLWIAIVAVLGAVGAAAGTEYSDSFGGFESEASRGFDLLEEGFGASAGENQGSIVFTAEQGADDPAVQSAMTDFFSTVAGLRAEGDIVLQSPYDNPQQISSQGDHAGQMAYARIQLPSDYGMSQSTAVAEEIRDLEPDLDGVEVYVGGSVFADIETPASEFIGIGFAIVILIVAFGSVLAMGLPIGMALAGVGAGVVVVGMVSNLVTMPDFTTTVAVMLGIGVGIDYALFIVTRFREDLHDGVDGEIAAGHALDTAGRAVLFAGTTVVISVLGMLAMGLGFIRGLAVGAAIAVAATMLASVTLLPALLGLAGDRIEVTRRRGIVAAGFAAVAVAGFGLGLPTAVALAFGGVAIAVLAVGAILPALKRPLAPRAQKAPRDTFWHRYSRFVQRHAWFGAIGGVGVLVVLALPVFGLRLAFADEGNYPEGSDTRVAYDLLAEGFGPGFNGPLALVAEVPPDVDEQQLNSITDTLANTDGVVAAEGPVLAPEGGVAQWTVIPATAPQAEETEALVRELRGPVLDEATAGTGVDVLVTGFTALAIDFSDYLGSRYLLFFSIVLGLSFLLLMAVFRSLLVPLKAVLANLLSIGAAYGVVVAVFQWGWGASLLDVQRAPVEPFIPMMLFAIVFGLSMDYEVFLLSRMKEEYDRTGDNARAVADGLSVTARVITAAALIMVVVFGSFILENDRVIQLLGTGLALAVLLDATIVRLLLVPSLMELLGDRNWWLPRWLDRVLPSVHIEGRELDESQSHPEPELVDSASRS